MSRERDEVTDALVRVCRLYGVKCLVQVGAHDGWEADVIRSAIGCRAVAIEGNTNCQPMSLGLEYRHAVIGATDGRTTFYLHKSPELSGNFQRDESIPVIVDEQRLDTFCGAMGIQPDALIIDTEGTTLEVLEGAVERLPGVRLIYAEVQHAPLFPGGRLLPEVEAFLSVRGFSRCEGLPAYGAGPQGNYLWVRP